MLHHKTYIKKYLINNSRLCSTTENIIKHTLKHNSKHNSKPLKNIKSQIKQFTTNHRILLESILHIISNIHTHYTLSTQIINLNNTPNSPYKIPSLALIIKYFLNNKTIFHNLPNSFHTLENNITPSTTLEHIYDYLIKNTNIANEIIEYISKLLYNRHLESYSALINEFPELKENDLIFNSFTSLEVLKDLDLNMNSGSFIIVTINYKNQIYNDKIFIYSYDVLDKKTIEKYSNEIVSRVLFFNELLETEHMPNKMILYLTNLQKEIDDSLVLEKHFKTINVNSAVTNSRDIIIYRKQELLKSIFHELIHFHNLDFRNIPTHIITKLIKTHNLNSENDYLLYEAITETMANFINNIFSIKTKSMSITNFENKLYNEILFSIYQFAKIMKILNYKKLNDFYTSRTNDKKFKQDSCMFSYYILKCYLLLNLDKYFTIFIDDKLKFIYDRNNIYKLDEIFDESRNNPNLHFIIDQLLKNNFNSRLTFKNIKNKNNVNQNTRNQNNIKLKNKSKINSKNNKTNKTNKTNINLTMRMTCNDNNIII